jgi:hypothetical protein
MKSLLNKTITYVVCVGMVMGLFILPSLVIYLIACFGTFEWIGINWVVVRVVTALALIYGIIMVLRDNPNA